MTQERQSEVPFQADSVFIGIMVNWLRRCATPGVGGDQTLCHDNLCNDLQLALQAPEHRLH